ncbi:MAG: glycosyltransferase family 2 protein [Bradyrhizobiaceae bacterium]|nr:glycosyltransferase family 2 protein [Bradyrhizobiaceae bacterium]
MNDLISVIVSTYNREDALDAVLRALSRQTDRDFEIIVADDGSGPATARVVQAWASRAPVPVRHVWHEDRGFRLADIRNRGILASAGAYIIFLDGDCIARPDFVAAHRRLAESGWFVTGTRVLLSPQLTGSVLRDGLEPERWALPHWAIRRARRDVNRIMPLLALPLSRLRKRLASRWIGARGANMAFWRRDLERVDGFDTTFQGWGREDSDIFIRMIRAGITRKDGRYATGVLHLWHPEADRSALAQNDAQVDEVLAGDRITARLGLSATAPAQRISLGETGT